MAWAILDTSVYIDHWERGLHEEALAEVRRFFIVRQCSVVLSELLRGARRANARRLVESLIRVARVQWAPTEEDWLEAGRIIGRLGDRHGWDRRKRRDFQNDALIALTARRHGAVVVTANRVDFELLADSLRMRMLFV